MSERKITCPRCQTALEIDTIRERSGMIEVDRCPKCTGIWFDKGELQQVEKITEPVLFEIRRLPNEEEQLEIMDCPSCGEGHPMEKHSHFRDENVIFDICTNCEGIWLDGGELEAIQQENWFKVFFDLMGKMK